MTQKSFGIATRAVLSAACVLGLDAGRTSAVTGTVLVQYDSIYGTLPSDQGWTYSSNCLKGTCPSEPTPPDPGMVSECWFQGENGNDCTLGHGCGPKVSPAFAREHYNAPIDPPGVTGACTFTEWLAFDDGEDYVDQGYPVPLPHRNLTFGPGYRATYWGPHMHPAFGAPGFVSAPSEHPTLRIVTGGGVHGVNTLPAAGGNNRNLGKINIRRDYVVPQGVTAITLVAKLACGNRSKLCELIQWVGVGRRFCIGVDGVDGSATLGRFTWGSTQSGTNGLFGSRTVAVSLARNGTIGPHSGEFFRVRLIMQNSGVVNAWLNDDPASLWTGTAATATDASVQINPDEQAGTMWIDYLQVLEGEVPPGGCGNPVFDTNEDRLVDLADLVNGQNGFADCATGPSPPAALYDSLSDRCRCHDFNHDRAIDMADFAAFQRCTTLGNHTPAPACDD